MKVRSLDESPLSSRGAVAKKVLVLLFASALVLVTLELGIGGFFPAGGQVYGPDEHLLYDAIPSSARIQAMPAARVKEGDATRVPVRIGPEGFRGAGLASPKRGKRVLVIGDSMVMAENVPHDSTFVQVLGRELSQRLVADDHAGTESSVETVNAGRAGYGPDQALLLLQRELERVEPDLIVCVLCAHNDFGDLMRNKLFRLGEQGVAEPCKPVLGARVLDRFSELEERSGDFALVRLWRFWRKNTAAAERERAQGHELVSSGLMNEYVRALEAQAREHFVDRNLEVVSLFEDVYDIDVAASLPNSFATVKVELMTGVLSRMVRFASEGGTPITFVVVPSAVDLCQDFGLKVDPVRFPSHERTALVESMVGAVGLAGGVAIDVTPALVGAGSADRYFVGDRDIHWNAAGQSASASFVAEELLRDNASAKALGTRPIR